VRVRAIRAVYDLCMDERSPPRRGRGALSNPENRFSTEARERDADADLDAPSPRTALLDDRTREIIAWNDSPDVGFRASVNPYRGCEHGCIYCYARPLHEYLGFSAGLDFETKIVVKRDAPALLRAALARADWTPQVVALSGATDAFQPIERKLELTRACLGVFAEFRNPVAVITKNHLVTRDIDHLAALAEHGAAAVVLSITTLNPELARAMEPRASRPQRRLQAVRELRAAGIPVGVNLAPIVPGLTDEEIPALVEASRDAGAQFINLLMLRLPHGVKDLFAQWLTAYAPARKDKVLARIRDVRGQQLNDARFGLRLSGEGLYAAQIQALFDSACRRAGLSRALPRFSIDAFRRPNAQLSLGF